MVMDPLVPMVTHPTICVVFYNDVKDSQVEQHFQIKPTSVLICCFPNISAILRDIA